MRFQHDSLLESHIDGGLQLQGLFIDLQRGASAAGRPNAAQVQEPTLIASVRPRVSTRTLLEGTNF